MKFLDVVAVILAIVSARSHAGGYEQQRSVRPKRPGEPRAVLIAA
jgi:hypothetical protein